MKIPMAWWLLIITLLLLTKAKAKEAAAANTGSMLSKAKQACNTTCGGVSVPYPFGIDDRNCAMNESFYLNCSRTDSPPKLMMGNIQVLGISLENGTLYASMWSAYSSYDRSGKLEKDFNVSITLGGGPFRFSHERNKLTAFGCDTMALMTDRGGSFLSGCLSVCTNKSKSLINRTDNSCSGVGCCQTPLPKSLKTLNITLKSIFEHDGMGEFMQTDLAFLADQTFDLSGLLNGTRNRDDFRTSNVTIEWVFKEEKCPYIDPNSRSGGGNGPGCGDNARCTYSENGQGYRCLCNDGFEGNPYQGCEDIDECKEGGRYKCEGRCKNTKGNYTCSCPLGMHGDGKVGCHGFRITTIAAAIGAAIFTVIIGALICIACRQQRKERNFLRNGGVLLKNQRVRIFTEAELAKATKNFNNTQLLGQGGFGFVYKGILSDNTQVAVKKPKDVNKIRISQEFQHEIYIVSQVNHKNVVKILGLCLQTKVPLLVYEFVSNGTLFHHIHDKSSQVLRTWKSRLRIAAETALALDYFHSLASPPIIHGDVKSSNILLDDNYTAKVADFGASVLISPDQTAIATNIQGTFGYLDPEYLMTGNLTTKSDVYSFGVVLIELLTGVKPGCSISCFTTSKEKINIIQYFLSSIESNTLSQILCFEVIDQDEMEEIEIVAELAKQCLSSSGIKRPNMKEVANELEKLKQLHDNLWAQKNSEETEHLLGESESSKCNFYEHATGLAAISKPLAKHHSQISFDIESYSYSM